MARKKVDSRSLWLGIAAGAGAAAVINRMGRDPEKSIEQRLVNRALDRSLARLRSEGPTRLEGQHRYVIFSDHHKGCRNGADDFRFCERAYLKALNYYYKEGWTLIVNGDAEELMEERVEDVVQSYRNVLELEACFHPDRLIRIYGNHDILWQLPAMVEKHLGGLFPGIKYREGLLFEYMEDGEVCGEVMVVHGFQGALDSDMFGWVAKYALPFYRDIQIDTGIGTTSPSRDACLRTIVDNRLYRWTARQRNLLMICGHTHRPVWSSKTHLEKLTEELYELLRERPVGDAEKLAHAQRVAEKRRELEARKAKEPPCNDVIKTRPSYFNDGCCRYDDGDVTGIEIEDGKIRLVKWSKSEINTVPMVLEENSFKELFLHL